MILYGKPVADALREQCAERIEENARRTRGKRTLTVIKDDTSDKGYLAAIQRAAERWKIDLMYADGLVQAAKMGASRVIDVRKRPERTMFGLYGVDGQGDYGRVSAYDGEMNEETSCTAEAIIRILDFYEIPLEGRNAVIIGRSDRVGKPVAMLMLARNSTITVCHSHTPKMELNAAISMADIIVCASGQKELLDYWTQVRYLDNRQTIINVGGDYSEKSLWAETSNVNLCPFRGGVGPVTAAVLMSHVLM